MVKKSHLEGKIVHNIHLYVSYRMCIVHNCGYMPLVSQKLTYDYARWGCGESGAMGAELRGRIKSVVTGTVPSGQICM